MPFSKIAILFIFLICSCSGSIKATNVVTPQKLSIEQKALLKKLSVALYKSLTLKQRLGQLFMLHVSLNTGNRIYQDIEPGGVFLDFRNTFTRRKGRKTTQNYGKLVKALKKVNALYLRKKSPPPLYSIDQEGGYHKLLKPANYFTALMAVGEAVYATGKAEWANYVGYYTCRDLRAAGIHWNLSPVTDVQMNPQNPVIRTRSFHSDPKLVSKLVFNYLQGHQTARCLDSIKHFPGHGDTNRDSHHDLPIVRKSMSKLLQEDLLPFKEIITKNAATGLMPAHIIYPRFEKKPATFSPYWLRKTLRQKWNFQGLIISDNLTMKAVPKFRKEKTFHKVGVDAIKAGIDVLLLTSHVNTFGYQMYAGVKKEYKYSKKFRKQVKEAVLRILYHKLKIGMLDTYLNQALIQKRPWAADQGKEVTQWLETSKQISNATIPKILSAKELNRNIAKAAIKTLVGAKDLEAFLRKSKKYVLFTDVKPTSSHYRRLKELKVKIFPLAELNKRARHFANAQILNTKVVTLRTNIRRWRKLRKKGRYLFYTVANPFPFRVIKAGLRKKDVLVSSFSKSRSSKRALIDAFISRQVPPKAGVRYK